MHRRLGELLTDGGFASQEVVDAALSESHRSNRRLGDVLISHGHLTREEWQAVDRLQNLVTDFDTALALAADDDELTSHLRHTGRIHTAQYPLLRRVLRRGKAIRRKDLNRMRRRHHQQEDNTDQAGIRLGDLLVASGDISRRQLRRALAEQQRNNEPLGHILLRHGWLAPSRMRRMVRMQHKLAAAAFGAAMAFSHSVHAESPADNASQDEVMVASLGSLQSPVGDTDLRFASLTDLNEHISSRKQRRSDIQERNRAIRERNARARASARIAETRKKQSAGKTRLTPAMVKPWVRQFAKEQRLPVDLIMAVIHTESNFVSNARSKANAIGLMQLIPKTGGRAAYTYLRGRKTTPTRQELEDPRTNIELGAAYLRLLSTRYFKDIEDRSVQEALVLAAYNWGPSRVRKLVDTEGVPGDRAAVVSMLKQHAPRETYRYVHVISERRQRYAADDSGLLAKR